MWREAQISIVLVVLAVTVPSAGCATIRPQQEAAAASARSTAVSASERSNDSAAATQVQEDGNLGRAAYTPFPETPAKPARRDAHASADQEAKEPDLTISALTVLAAVGALIYLVRRAWAG
ncbi:hypothetical protein [Variovorax sp. GT1P44]|uniref:hypothetical protein n=1 Tax=Variovorax sp. GT1P44 TaxID=3443742 RepID=UPI003F465BE7